MPTQIQLRRDTAADWTSNNPTLAAGEFGWESDTNRFKIGTGFNNSERLSPPALGSIITFRFRGKTNKGTPRFASFMRVRNDF